jgi:hypothetical protein
MTMMSVPRPVSTPPTEGASRQPSAVVSNSGMARRWAERRARKARWYQLLVAMRRQSRASLSARSCPRATLATDHRRQNPGVTQRICVPGWRPRHHAGNATEPNRISDSAAAGDLGALAFSVIVTGASFNNVVRFFEARISRRLAVTHLVIALRPGRHSVL